MSVNTSNYLDLFRITAIRYAFFPVEHVFERLKLESQKNPYQSTTQSIKEVWKLKGFKGLFAGSFANASKRVLKDSYQLPVTIFFNQFWRKILPEKYNPNHLGSNILTGLSVAGVVQTGVTLPLERIFIEQVVKEGYRPFFNELKKRGIIEATKTLYQGYQITLIRQSFGWTTFFTFNHLSALFVVKIDKKNNHPNICWLSRGIITSGMVVSLMYPLEFFKNRILIEPQIVSKGTLNGVTALCRSYTLSQIYRGAPIAFAHTCIQILFLQTLFDKINK